MRDRKRGKEKEKEEREKEKKRVATFVYPTAHLPVSMVAKTPIFQGTSVMLLLVHC